MPLPIRITHVRLNDKEAHVALENFIFGGEMSGPRVLRGMNPEYVSKFIRENVKTDSEADAYHSALECLRFYERPEAAISLALALDGRERNADDIRRSAFAIQAMGDFSAGDPLKKAADYFDRSIVPRAEASKVYPLLLQTAEALAPEGALEKLAARLAGDVQAAAKKQNLSEADMAAHDRLAAVQRNELPAAQARAAGKKQLLAMSADERRPQLVKIYMGRSSMSDTYLETWAGRQLRLEAMLGKPGPVYAEFERALNDVAARMPPAQAGFYIVRAAQAIIYLQGELSAGPDALYKSAKGGGMNFLWDDP